ncbi:MAG TPA: hypothetical protein VIG78_07820, partial [Gemmatimonadaceae bacterium]
MDRTRFPSGGAYAPYRCSHALRGERRGEQQRRPSPASDPQTLPKVRARFGVVALLELRFSHPEMKIGHPLL